MSTTEKLMAELREALPMTRELMLADIAKTYGPGFADALRKQIEREAGGRTK